MVIPNGMAFYAVWLYGDILPGEDGYRLWHGESKDAAEEFVSMLTGPYLSYLVCVRPTDGNTILFNVVDESQPQWVAEQVRIPGSTSQP